MLDDQQANAASKLRDVATNQLYSEPFWFRAAFMFALAVLALVLPSAFITLCVLDPAARTANIDIIYKLGLIGVGIVTFCTVVWRGLISARQADTQREQIAKLSEQIATTDDNNRAKLLLEGAEMLSDTKPEKVAAGIAALQAVASSNAESFAIEAMDLLVEFISDRGQIDIDDKNVRRAVSSVNSINKRTKRQANSLAIFKTSNSNHVWPHLAGARYVFYESGCFVFDLIDDASFAKARVSLERVVFQACEINTSSRVKFTDCLFQGCTIRGIDSGDLQRCTFENCDFSGAIIQNDYYQFPDLRQGGNFYQRVTPPTFQDVDVIWRGVLQER